MAQSATLQFYIFKYCAAACCDCRCLATQSAQTGGQVRVITWVSVTLGTQTWGTIPLAKQRLREEKAELPSESAELVFCLKKRCGDRADVVKLAGGSDFWIMVITKDISRPPQELPSGPNHPKHALKSNASACHPPTHPLQRFRPLK